MDVLREEHAERLRRAAEQAERQRQLQMAHKLDIMRKKKQEYLQYQRQLALQRVQVNTLLFIIDLNTIILFKQQYFAIRNKKEKCRCVKNNRNINI